MGCCRCLQQLQSWEHVRHINSSAILRIRLIQAAWNSEVLIMSIVLHMKRLSETLVTLNSWYH